MNGGSGPARRCYAWVVTRRLGIALGAFVFLALLGLDAPAVRAQDWGLTREPRGGGVRPTGRGGSSGGSRAGAGRAGAGRAGAGRAGAGRAGAGRAGVGGDSQAPPGEGGERSDVLIQRYLRILEADPRETFAFRRLLDLYRERDGNIDRLVADLNARVAQDGDAFAPRMLLGHIYKAQSRHDDARSAYQRAAELRPTDPAPLVALAQIERATTHPVEARRLYDTALERTRDRLAREELLREVAEVAMEAQDFDGARRYFEELARGSDQSVYLRAEFARALAAARQWDRAVEEYERVIRSLHGDNRVLPPVLLELARAQLERGEVEPSIATLGRALSLAGREAGIRAEIYDQMLSAYRRGDRLPELAERLRHEARAGFEAIELLARIEDELGNDEEALAAYRRALRARGRDIDTRVRIIQLLSRSGRLDDVVEEYRALIRSAPREPRFVVELAQLLVQTDHRADALRLVRDAGARNARDPILHQQLAELYTRWGENDLASREIELLARIDPSDPAHIVALGAQQFDAGARDAAIATWRRVVEVEHDRASGHATLAAILGDHDLLPEAIVEWREAVRLRSDDISFVRGLSTALERHHQHDEAETQWRRVLELSGDDRVSRREARERIVGIWTRTRRLPAQIRDLEARFRADPPDPEAGRFLAEAHRRRGAHYQAQAERVLERIVELEPGDVESLLALERIRRQRGDLAGAIDVLRLLRDADPRRAGHYLSQMAEHALALYRDEEAVRYAAEAVERNPDDASAHQRLGDLYRSRQDTEHAILSYRRALELNERLYPVYFELAELDLARGEIERADQLYRQVLRITPDDDLVARAARASIQINLGAGTLETLERDLLPLALGHPQRPVYRRLAVELYDAYAGPLVLRARRGGPEAAEAAVELRQIGTRAIKPLLEALADQDPSQRRVALDILGDLGNANAAAPLLAVAENGTLDVGQRMQALLAAGAVATPTLVPRFAALASGDDGRLQGLATWGLARIGGRDATRALERLLRSGDATVRGFAALGLGVNGGSAAAPDLDRMARTESDEDVIFAATWALGRTGDPSRAQTLVLVLDARGGAVAEVAADALGRVGGPVADAALVRSLFDPDAALRRAAARALRRSAAASASQDVLPPPQSFERVRDYVHRIADRDANAPPVDDLSRWQGLLEAAASEALRGPVERVLPALTVLTSRAHGVGLGALTADLDRWPDEARGAAERSLDALAFALVDELVEVASHVDAAVRIEAVRLLVRLPGAESDRAVAAALSTPPASVQRAALDALWVADREPTGAMLERLAELTRSHRDWSMRTRAARAMARSSSEEAREALREALATDHYAFVREAAATALSRHPAEAVEAALVGALETDGEPPVRAAAARALIGLAGEVGDRARRRAAADPSPAVRAIATPSPRVR